MKRVLVTGGSGFIGRHCLAMLTEQDHEVHAVASQDKSVVVMPGVRWHIADLLMEQQVGDLVASVQPTHLLHLAWYAAHGKFWTSLENVRWLGATLGLLQTFARHGGRRFVGAGSCAEYEWDGIHGYLSEFKTPLRPATLYGACKLATAIAQEALCRECGVSCAWGRIFFLYGPHENPARFVPSVIVPLLRNEPARCSHGNQLRDFLYVSDVARAFVALLHSEVTGPVNIASGRTVALKEIAQAIGRKLGRADWVQLGSIPARDGDPPALCGKVDRLSSEVGWTPQYDLERGLQQTIDWWRAKTGPSPSHAI